MLYVLHHVTFEHATNNNVRQEWTVEEDVYVVEQQKQLGNKWADIARCMNGRLETTTSVFLHFFLAFLMEHMTDRMEG